MKRVKMAFAALFVSFVSYAAGCGLSPQQACKDAVDASCKKTAECLPGLITEEGCKMMAKANTNCDNAEPCSGGKKYSTTQAQKCIDDFKATTCEQLKMGMSPASCNTVCQ
jgi:hypothetical protein